MEMPVSGNQFGKPEYELSEYLTYLYIPGDPDERIPTANGKMAYYEWCTAEVKRLNAANPARRAALDVCGGRVAVKACCYHPVNINKKRVSR